MTDCRIFTRGGAAASHGGVRFGRACVQHLDPPLVHGCATQSPS